MKTRIIALLGAVIIIIGGFLAMMAILFSTVVLFGGDPGLGLYLFGGGGSMVAAWFYFNAKYARPLIRVAIR